MPRFYCVLESALEPRSEPGFCLYLTRPNCYLLWPRHAHIEMLVLREIGSGGKVATAKGWVAMTLLVIGCVRGLSATTLYVSPSGSNLPPYADWSTAAT